ncbi:tripartite ATP-independent transporter DctP family solute receptor [Anaerosolibacter carboniphilus]|uniref:Tripartite ATP-independent transporter DctP family solute receptor n=1 Tax=Anaerosolibacter carboniphilus TaxID=1417629 RepID=A0A841KWH1_9FIRM|nr:TRAP transporter substrate-binding protein [Anaerosolibacter carboniphilus]MBB6215272.1 tripartite ATP-independent transporter DctP family solute receptor [Anaerosolibacter carboniphilus]
MKRFKSMIALTMIVLMMLSLAACGAKPAQEAQNGEKAPEASAEPRTFNLAMDSPEDTVTYLFGQKFGQLLEEKSGGKFKVQLYANGQMGSDKEIAESVQTGNLDFVVQTTAPQVNFVPKLAVFDMAMVYPDAATARKVLDGPFFDTISKVYEESGFKILGFADQGFRTLTSNKKVQTLADLKGQKIRTMENPNHIEFWKSLGANPTPMAWGEVYIGLQQGAIDGQENPYEVIAANKIYEQQKYVINTNHMLHTLTLITNPALYNGLSPEDQKIFDEAAAEAKVFAREQADARLADRAKIITDNGAEILDISPEVRAEMQAKAESAYDLIRSKVGDELVDGLLNAVKEVK